ncbi:MAG TPA: indole-3-glycerol phosphate synthase TrpC [Solirubrobacteraceae bacterium]|jgi:indole-3-glycerol phosphate synthase|nr:indole-3-glycerol phosphate synthase TrpC [Solirubrobacteraceae bacterium]
MNVLMEIVADTRNAVTRRAAAVPLPALIEAGEQRRAGPDATRDFRGALAAPGISVIAEHKRSSPSAGVIRADLALADVVGSYERAGARALSVLTEGVRFGGALEDLAAARAASSLPILRKDFIVEEYQVYEALAGGADAILLIVAALDTGTLIRLHSLATQLGLATLVEVHDAIELDAAHEIGAEIVGINNRDLTTLQVEVERTYELLPGVRDGALVVAESGFREQAQLVRLQDAGVDAVLVGEALMRAPDIEAATRQLLGSTG